MIVCIKIFCKKMDQYEYVLCCERLVMKLFIGAFFVNCQIQTVAFCSDDYFDLSLIYSMFSLYQCLCNDNLDLCPKYLFRF